MEYVLLIGLILFVVLLYCLKRHYKKLTQCTPAHEDPTPRVEDKQQPSTDPVSSGTPVVEEKKPRASRKKPADKK